jgi:hypothetical protein
MKKIFLVTILMAIVTVSSLPAQSKINFRSQNYAGLLEGDAGSSWQLQTINGFQKRTWFAGLGTGLDFYRYRTVPLFLSVNKSIKPAGNSFYFLSDAGINFAWVNKELRSPGNDFISDKFTPALYWNSGVGYKAVIGKKENALLINMGYSYKHLKETKELPVFCINPPCPPNIEEYNYHLKRISIRLGWEF